MHLFGEETASKFSFHGRDSGTLMGTLVGGTNKPNSCFICTDSAAALMALTNRRAEGRADLITELQLFLYKIYLSGLI